MLFFVLFSCAEEKQKTTQHHDNFVQGEVVRITSPSNGDVVQPHLDIIFEAGEQIQGLAVAMQAGITKSQLDQTIGIHPTMAEEWVTMRTPRES